MNKKVEILISVIIIAAILIVIFQLVSVKKGIDLTGKSIISPFKKLPEINEEELDTLFEKGLNAINEEEKYLDFIAESGYSSVTLLITKNPYYFEYNKGKNEVTELTNVSQEVETDFTVKINKREYYKLKISYEEGDYGELSLRLMNQLPGKVKIKLFQQCMETEWCKSGNF